MIICKNSKKVFITILLVLSVMMLGRVPIQAADKNPYSAKNTYGENTYAGNTYATKSKPIRKTPITDSVKLMQMGEKLWNDTKLGTSGSACATCHPDGQGLKTAPFPKYIEMPDDILTLDQMIGFCITILMKGKALPWNSEKMTALAAYAQSHAKEESKPVNPCSMKNPCGSK
jgi:cytochrome c553